MRRDGPAARPSASAPDGPTARERAAAGDPRGALAPTLAVAVFFTLHRVVVFAALGRPFRELVEANPEWLTWQFLPLEVLRADLVDALLALQQGPPLPHLLLGLVAAASTTPWELARSLLLAGTVLSFATVMLLQRLLAETLGWRWRAAAVAGVFAVGADLVYLEYDGLGQYVYMFLAMALATALVLSLHRAVGGDDPRWTGVAGTLCAGLALTRASFSYLGLPLVLLLTVAPVRFRRAHLAALALPVLLLQGGWSLKNLLVWDDWRWASSTWAGGNAVIGLVHAGLGDELRADFLGHAGDHPEWLVERVRTDGWVPWGWDTSWSPLPEAIRERDLEAEARFGAAARRANSVGQRVVLDEYLAIYRGFARRHPDRIAWKARLGYKLYWFPIRYHASHYLGLVSCTWQVEPTTTPWSLVGDFVSGRLPEPTFLTRGGWPHLERVPFDPPTAEHLAVLTWYGTFVVLHLLTPLAALGLAVRWLRDRRLDPPMWLFFAALVLYAYSAGLTSLVEFRENMRFRLTLEPVIWWLVAATGSRLGGLVAARLSR